MNDFALELVMKEKIAERIKKDEGFRSAIYLDIVSVPTGGWGHAFLVGSTLPRSVWEDIFSSDFSTAWEATANLVWQRGYSDIGWARKGVLCNMIFNLGLSGLLKFQKMFAALDKRNYKEAAAQMLDSKWAKQVGERATRLAYSMETGTIV